MKLSEEEKQKRRDYYQKNKQLFIDKAKAWKKANPEKARESSRKSQAKLNNTRSKQERKNQYLLQKYGISLEQYSDMYHAQQGACAICKTPLEFQSMDGEGSKTAHVDHDHITGNVRGLLCNPCNRGIGYLKDSSTVLRLAAEYLDASKC